MQIETIILVIPTLLPLLLLGYTVLCFSTGADPFEPHTLLKELAATFRHLQLIGKRVVITSASNDQASFRGVEGKIVSIQKRQSDYSWQKVTCAQVEIKTNSVSDYKAWIPLTALSTKHKRDQHLLPEGTPLIIKGKKGGEKRMRRMPRLFRFALLLALIVLVWDFVAHANDIVLFVVDHFLLHK